MSAEALSNLRERFGEVEVTHLTNQETGEVSGIKITLPQYHKHLSTQSKSFSYTTWVQTETLQKGIKALIKLDKEGLIQPGRGCNSRCPYHDPLDI